MSIFQELIKVVESRKEIELTIAKAKEEFEQTIAKEKEAFKVLGEDEDKLREEVLATLTKNDEINVVVDNMSITRQTRKTLKITDPVLLLASMSAETNSLIELGVDIPEIHKAFKHELVVMNKKVVMDAVEKYENVEGKLLGGVEEQKTNFLVIKENK